MFKSGFAFKISELSVPPISVCAKYKVGDLIGALR